MWQGMTRNVVERTSYIPEAITGPQDGPVGSIVKIDMVNPREVDDQVAVSATEAIGSVGVAARASVDCGKYELTNVVLCSSGCGLTRDALWLAEVRDQPGNIFRTVWVRDGKWFEVYASIEC